MIGCHAVAPLRPPGLPFAAGLARTSGDYTSGAIIVFFDV